VYFSKKCAAVVSISWARNLDSLPTGMVIPRRKIV
jgi:hypothetical protein